MFKNFDTTNLVWFVFGWNLVPAIGITAPSHLDTIVTAVLLGIVWFDLRVVPLFNRNNGE